MEQSIQEKTLNATKEFLEEKFQEAWNVFLTILESVKKLPLYEQALEKPDDEQLWQNLLDQAIDILGKELQEVSNSRFFASNVGSFLGTYLTLLRVHLQEENKEN